MTRLTSMIVGLMILSLSAWGLHHHGWKTGFLAGQADVQNQINQAVEKKKKEWDREHTKEIADQMVISKDLRNQVDLHKSERDLLASGLRDSQGRLAAATARLSQVSSEQAANAADGLRRYKAAVDGAIGDYDTGCRNAGSQLNLLIKSLEGKVELAE